jgi:hypothetical protein
LAEVVWQSPLPGPADYMHIELIPSNTPCGYDLACSLALDCIPFNPVNNVVCSYVPLSCGESGYINCGGGLAESECELWLSLWMEIGVPECQSCSGPTDQYYAICALEALPYAAGCGIRYYECLLDVQDGCVVGMQQGGNPTDVLLSCCCPEPEISCELILSAGTPVGVSCVVVNWPN